MNQYTFERYEKKYLLSAAQYRQFREKAAGHLTEDQYGKSAILSVYYDTPDARLIRASMEKPAYKEKLRLRSYGRPGEDDEVFVELKKKYRGIVYKRRVEMPLGPAQAWLAGRAKRRTARSAGKSPIRSRDTMGSPPPCSSLMTAWRYTIRKTPPCA